ncbi:MAG TPA: hypothetical protein VFV36_05830, partial [Candidatus Methylomirabilis sp.]|nr:hypothetical protein [Candidatus Methylomirabilis sp.]
RVWPAGAVLASTILLGGNASAPEAEPPAATDAPKLITIEFGGGPLSDYVELLRRNFDVNVVLGSEVRDLPMPTLSLKKVSLDTAMNLIPAMSRSLSGEGGTVDVKTIGDPDEGGAVFMVDLVDSAPMPGQPRLMQGQTGVLPIPPRVIRGMPGCAAGPPVRGAAPVRTVQVFSIKLLTQPISGRNDLAIEPESVLTAIDTALALSQGEEPAQVKFHPETGLLFVHGTPAQTEAVSILIKTLMDDQIQLQRSVPQESQKLVDKLTQENQQLRDEVASLRAELVALRQRVDAPERQLRPARPAGEPTRP